MNVELPAPPARPVLPPRNKKAVWALVLGVLGIWSLTLLATIPALVLGHVAMGEIHRSDERGRGLALAAIIVGWCTIGLLVILGLLLVSLAASCGGDTYCG